MFGEIRHTNKTPLPGVDKHLPSVNIPDSTDVFDHRRYMIRLSDNQSCRCLRSVNEVFNDLPDNVISIDLSIVELYRRKC